MSELWCFARFSTRTGYAKRNLLRCLHVHLRARAHSADKRADNEDLHGGIRNGGEAVIDTLVELFIGLFWICFWCVFSWAATWVLCKVLDFVWLVFGLNKYNKRSSYFDDLNNKLG